MIKISKLENNKATIDVREQEWSSSFVVPFSVFYKLVHKLVKIRDSSPSFPIMVQNALEISNSKIDITIQSDNELYLTLRQFYNFCYPISLDFKMDWRKGI